MLNPAPIKKDASPVIRIPLQRDDASTELKFISELGRSLLFTVHINGEIRGAIITGFASKNEFTEQKARLIDAATQMAAMSVNLSAHYEAALNNSINETREEHRKFTEAILDALPVSLYVVDRDF